MENLRTKDKVAIVIAVLTAITVAQNNDAIDILLGVAINVGIVYGIAAILDFFKNRS
jgi:hypothetical protein